METVEVPSTADLVRVRTCLGEALADILGGPRDLGGRLGAANREASARVRRCAARAVVNSGASRGHREQLTAGLQPARLAPDPMRRRAGPEPHDLLLGMAPAHLPENAPAWVCAALKAGWPVVVRRAPADPARVAIGVRGLAREQRWAGWMPLAVITRRLRPEALGQREPAMLRDLPAWRACATCVRR